MAVPVKGFIRQIEQARQATEIGDVGRGEDQADPRQAAGAGRIDLVFRVRMRRAQHQRMQRFGRCVIIGIAALAANERIVFLAPNALTDTELYGSHGISGYILELP